MTDPTPPESDGRPQDDLGAWLTAIHVKLCAGQDVGPTQLITAVGRAAEALSAAPASVPAERPDTAEARSALVALAMEVPEVTRAEAWALILSALDELDAAALPAAVVGDEPDGLTAKEADELLNLRTFRDHGGLTDAGNKRLRELADKEAVAARPVSADLDPQPARPCAAERILAKALAQGSIVPVGWTSHRIVIEHDDNLLLDDEEFALIERLWESDAAAAAAPSPPVEPQPDDTEPARFTADAHRGHVTINVHGQAEAALTFLSAETAEAFAAHVNTARSGRSVDERLLPNLHHAAAVIRQHGDRALAWWVQDAAEHIEDQIGQQG